MVRKETVRARAIPRDSLLEEVNNQENKITFNITYHPVFGKVSKILEEHVILASDNGHKKT